MPGTRRFVFAEYAAYSSPKASIIILSSAPTRSAKRIANAIKFDGPATQFGMTSAWPMEYRASAKYIGWADTTINALRDESMLLTYLEGDRPIGTEVRMRPVEQPKTDDEARHPGDEGAGAERVLSERKDW